jgi:signal peptidase II
LFTVATAVLLLLLVIVAWRRACRRWAAVALSLFIVGGFSNWIDRLVDGKVVDFLNVGIGGVRTGVFNVADVAIMVGAVLFLFAESSFRRVVHPSAL